MTIIAPSLLAADLTRLGAQIEELERGGADWLHVDIMDGHFVPNISFGPSFVRAVRSISSLPLDVHLMIENADYFLDAFRNAGADRITVQYEASLHLWRTLEVIRTMGANTGIAINPATPIEALTEVLGTVDLVLVMTVEPGFGGQVLIPQTLHKIRNLARLKAEGHFQFLIQVDGGIDASTAGVVSEAGAEVLVSGTGILSHKNIPQAIQELRNAATLTQ